MTKKKSATKKVASRAAQKKTLAKKTLAKKALGKSQSQPRCGLCGATTNLTKTACCNNWICDDESSYVMFSYSQNSCSRNHWRYTLCGAHYNEQHAGSWQDCEKCRTSFETEMYVYYGTNEFNFEVLQNPPEYEPTKCAACGKIIKLGQGGYMSSREGYWCGRCAAKKL